jgi:predicted nucleic acid-binding protein
VSQTCVVADAGPLIGLARIGRLDLLRGLFRSTFVPPAVYAECVRAPDKPGATAISEAVNERWLTQRSPSRPVPETLRAGLGPGECEAITLALELQCPVLLDDRIARAAARAAGSSIVGTAGLLLAAKSRSLIPLVGPVLAQLKGTGYHFSDELVTNILALAGEKR